MNSGLTLYLNGSRQTSLLLLGQRGLPMLDEAKQAAARLLDTNIERLDAHPDYLYVTNTDKKSIGVEDVLIIQDKASLKPSVSETICIIVDGIDLMPEAAQNKLLKLVEEGECILIFVAYSDAVLPTIKSRVRIIEYRPLGMEQFNSFCTAHQLSEAEMLYFITGGCPGLALEYPGATDIFKQVKASVNTDPLNLYNILHLVKEKDKDNFYLNYPELTDKLFKLIGNETSSVETLRAVSDALINMGLGNYSKDDFFGDIVAIVESLRRE